MKYKIISVLIFSAELPGLHGILELSSSSLNSLTIRFHTWSPQNGGGSEPQGYRVEMRLNNDGESWTSGPEIEHIPTVTAYTVLLDNLEPHTYYYIRVTPFIEDGGLAYYGTPTQASGPFLTTDEGRWLHSTVTYTTVAYKTFDLMKIICKLFNSTTRSRKSKIIKE